MLNDLSVPMIRLAIFFNDLEEYFEPIICMSNYCL